MRHKLSTKVFFILFFLAMIPAQSFGQSDLFEVMTPNAMIIFDTSSSMNMDVNGLTVNSGAAKGVDAVSRDYEGGGNHPNSKLFQAKLALSEVIKDLENINLGFATYGQFKTEYVTGLYYRDRKDYTTPTDDKWRWSKLYWRFNNYKHGGWQTTSFSSDSFTDVWSKPRAGVSIGTTFTLPHTFDNSPGNNSQSVPPPHPPGTYSGELTITVTNIVYNPEYNWYTFYYTDSAYDHYEESSLSYDFANNDPIDCDSVFAKNWPGGGGWKTYDSKDDVQKSSPAKWACKGPNKIAGIAGGFGNWYKEYWWGQYGGTVCPSPVGSEQNPSEIAGQHRWTQWFLVDPKSNSLPGGHSVNVTGMSCYDSSAFVYPADGSANYPHTWSYFKTSGAVWPNPNPTYPAPSGDPGKNDNHWFFINFPEVDDSLNNYSVRKTIVSLMDLSPVQSPYNGKFHTKLPLKTHDPDPNNRNSITSNTSATPTQQTPLADSLAMTQIYYNEYINNYKGGDAPSKAKCRGNFVILLTDGLESCRFSDPPTNSKVYYDLAPQNAAKLLADLTVKTFVIGFGKDIKGNDTLNSIASSGGTERAYFATNLDELREALKKIFQAIGGSYARSNPTVNAQSGDRIYRAYFNLPGWEGHLIAYQIEGDGNVGDKLWDAGKQMWDVGRGSVYTWDKDKDPKLQDFSSGSGSLKDLLNPSGEDVNEDGKKDEEDSKTIINFILGANYNDGKHGAGYYKGKRSPNWKLGDIYHSTPLVVGKPPFNFPDSMFSKKYSDFKKATEKRGTVVYVGANDGMLHAFDDTNGQEKFAVVPKNLLGNLKNLRTDHQFFVDSSPRMIDAFLKGKGEWRTVLISGERSGGKYYYALDITDPNSPEILWEKTDDKDKRMGNTWSRPVMGIVRLKGEDKVVAFAGGGYSDLDNEGNSFYVIDVETGDILRRFDIGNEKNKVPAGATVLDGDLDGLVDAVYFGDFQGVLWKIKIGKEEDISKWQAVKLYEPAVKGPIFYPPAVTKNNNGDVLVYFGQGNELNIFEKDKYYYFFEIWDKESVGVKNWELKFKNKGEKVLAAPSVANNVVYFTTWEYTGIEENCGAGQGRLYGLTSTRQGSAGGADALVLDLDTGKQLPEAKKYFDLGKGIPSAPVVTNGMIYVSSSIGGAGGKGGAGGPPTPIPIPKWSSGKIKSWREVF